VKDSNFPNSIGNPLAIRIVQQRDLDGDGNAEVIATLDEMMLPDAFNSIASYPILVRQDPSNGRYIVVPLLPPLREQVGSQGSVFSSKQTPTYADVASVRLAKAAVLNRESRAILTRRTRVLRIDDASSGGSFQAHEVDYFTVRRWPVDGFIVTGWYTLYNRPAGSAAQIAQWTFALGDAATPIVHACSEPQPVILRGRKPVLSPVKLLDRFWPPVAC
jgi:hypothetical protein